MIYKIGLQWSCGEESGVEEYRIVVCILENQRIQLKIKGLEPTTESDTVCMGKPKGLCWKAEKGVETNVRRQW